MFTAAVQLRPVAGVLAAVVTYPTADGWEGVIIQNGAVGICKAPLRHQRQVALGALVNWAGIPARSNTLFLNRVGVRDGLRIELVDGFALRETAIEPVWQADRARCGAIATAGAF